MSDEIETIDRNPKSWAAWKREAERLQKIIDDMAEMDSEPVAWTWQYREQWHVTSDPRRAEFVAKDGDVDVQPLYRHAQPAPETEREPIAWLNDAYLARGVVDGEAGNSFSDLDLEGMSHGNNPQANAYRELLAYRRNSPVIGIDPASGPDRTAEVRYVAPPGYVMVPPGVRVVLRMKWQSTSRCLSARMMRGLAGASGQSANVSAVSAAIGCRWHLVPAPVIRSAGPRWDGMRRN